MTQLAFDFDVDCNEGELFLSPPALQDPCEWCKTEEAAHTITIKGKDQGICNSCAEDDYYDWHEQMND